MPPAAGASRDVVLGLAVGLALPAGAAVADPARAAKALASVEAEIAGLRAKLANLAYLDRAPAEVVEKSRKRLSELEERRAALGSGAAG